MEKVDNICSSINALCLQINYPYTPKLVGVCLVGGVFGLILLLASNASVNYSARTDINKDGKITIIDLSLLLSKYQTNDTNADINVDGKVTIIDVSILLSYFGKTVAPGDDDKPLPSNQTIIGLHTGNRDIDYRATTSLKPRIVRVGGLSAGMSKTEIQNIADQYRAKGARIIALVDFNGAPPSEGDAKNIGSWAGVSGVEAIEFGNEPWISPMHGGYFPETYDSANPSDPYNIYATRYKIALQAVQSVNPAIPLIAVGDSANTNHRPAEKTFAAMKKIGVKPPAIQIHPYGPNYMNRLSDAKRDLANAGWPDVPIWVTEVGIATDNGNALNDNYGWNTHMTYDEASATLTRVTTDLAREGVKRIIIYMGTDYRAPGASNEREWYFGLTKQDGTDKGVLTRKARQLFKTPHTYVAPYELGANTIEYGGDSPVARSDTVDKIVASKASWVRINFMWSKVQPSAPTSSSQFSAPYMGVYDEYINKLRDKDIEVLVTISNVPGWAKKPGNSYEPTSEALTQFMTLIANRYKGKVLGYQPFNEVNAASHWPSGAAGYSQMLSYIYPVIKKADPDTLVVSAGLAYNIPGVPPYLQSMYQARTKKNFDVLAVHLYPLPCHPPKPCQDLNAYLRNIQSVMTAANDTNSKIWVTELGLSTVTGVSQQSQADYARYYLPIIAQHADSVSRVVWYELRDHYSSSKTLAQNQAEKEYNFGVYDVHGSPKLIRQVLIDFTQKEL